MKTEHFRWFGQFCCYVQNKPDETNPMHVVMWDDISIEMEISHLMPCILYGYQPKVPIGIGRTQRANRTSLHISELTSSVGNVTGLRKKGFNVAEFFCCCCLLVCFVSCQNHSRWPDHSHSDWIFSLFFHMDYSYSDVIMRQHTHTHEKKKLDWLNQNSFSIWKHLSAAKSSEKQIKMVEVYLFSIRITHTDKFAMNVCKGIDSNSFKWNAPCETECVCVLCYACVCVFNDMYAVSLYVLISCIMGDMENLPFSMDLWDCTTPSLRNLFSCAFQCHLSMPWYSGNVA